MKSQILIKHGIKNKRLPDIFATINFHYYHIFSRDLNFSIIDKSPFSKQLNLVSQATGSLFLNINFCNLFNHNEIRTQQATG